MEIIAAGFNARQIEDLVDDVQEMTAGRVDVPGILFVGEGADGPEHFLFHNLGKPHDGIQGRSQLVAHGGEEARLGFVGGFGAPPGFIRDGGCFFELRNQAVFLGAEFNHRKGCRVEPARQIHEEDVNADGHQSQGVIERIVERNQTDGHSNRHWHGAGQKDAAQR